MSSPNDRFPTLYMPHGGGPCFFMDPGLWPAHMWDRMADYLRRVGQDIGRAPRAIVVISGHWEAERPTVNASAAPPMLFDYSGFPEHTYRLSYPAPGDPALAERVAGLLTAAGLAPERTVTRGFDHGVFVPFLLAFPQADVPIVQLSLRADLDPAAHLAMGRALAPLRDEDVLIVGSGMSYHNVRALFGVADGSASESFDAWLTQAIVHSDPERRERLLLNWSQAPRARECHPRSDHLLPLLVAAGAAGPDRGHRTYTDLIGPHRVSAFQFGPVHAP